MFFYRTDVFSRPLKYPARLPCEGNNGKRQTFMPNLHVGDLKKTLITFHRNRVPNPTKQ